MVPFDKTDRKEMNSEKSSSVCKQKYKGIKRVHKLKYLLGRKRLRLNYRDKNEKSFMPKVE